VGLNPSSFSSPFVQFGVPVRSVLMMLLFCRLGIVASLGNPPV
jgi:hypothetical protein